VRRARVVKDSSINPSPASWSSARACCMGNATNRQWNPMPASAPPPRTWCVQASGVRPNASTTKRLWCVAYR
jgi:hypothetical protein